MNSSNIQNINIFENVHRSLYQFLGIPLCISGNIGILFSIWIFHRKSWRKNVCVFYFFICLLNNFININSMLLRNIIVIGFNNQLLNTSVILCKLSNYILFIFEVMSPSILVLASIDRLLISSNNVETRLYSSRRLAYFSLSISIIIWSIFFIHILVKFDIYQLGPLSAICTFEYSRFYLNFLNNSQLIISTVLLLLMIFLSVFSYKNVRQIKLVPRQQRQNIRTMHRKDFQLLRCLFTKNIVHIICNSLIVIYAIYTALSQYQIRTTWEQARNTFIFNLGIFVHLIPYCVDLYIYSIFSKAFRLQLKCIVWKLFRQNIDLNREENKPTEIRNGSAE
ncbi:hypothetical protein I4U23_003930 [Adineta vaga]|nr:hypothetical protein I4U23_003930 [Adineta vaga]